MSGVKNEDVNKDVNKDVRMSDPDEDRALSQLSSSSSSSCPSSLSEGHFVGEPGTTIHQYELDEYLGHGSYAVVWSVKSDSEKALKIGREDDLSDRESRMLGKISPHENVIRLYEAFAWNRRTVMVVDVMDIDLFTLRREYDFDRFDVCRQLVAGIGHIHSCGVIHCDIKPENVLARFDEASKKWIIKLCDFGGASATGGTDICDYGQTVAYRSPEMIVGDSKAIQPPVDMWSYAAIVFEIFTENVLFDPYDSKYYSARSTASYESSLRSNAEQLALMEELLGKFPKKFTKKHREYFNARGRIKNLGDIKKIDLRVVMIVECELSKELAQSLHDFLLPLLRYNPKLRASAQDCFSHPFLSRTDVMAATNSAAVGSKDHASGDEKGEDARVEHGVGIIDGDEEKA